MSATFERIDALCDSNPEQAVLALDSIDCGSLSERERHRYDLLSIKSDDKNYVRHTSDSLILDVIEYYSSHKDGRFYPEALYYGGRVYSDMGDLPTALEYFQNALDALPEKLKSLDLKARTLSQISGVLRSLRLYPEAKEYAEEALKTDSVANDSVSMMYDYELLATISMQSKHYAPAEVYYKNAKEFAADLIKSDTVIYNMYLGANKYFSGDIDSALVLMRSSINDVDSVSRNTALAYASYIYLKANIPDTAISYAKELIKRKDFLNRKAGYKVLLSDNILPALPKDSVLRYVKNYRDEMEMYLSQNGNQSALIQNSFYNYQNHLRDKIKLEKTNRQQEIWITILILALALSMLCFLCYWGIKKYQVMKLCMALFTLIQMRMELIDDNQTKSPEDFQRKPIVNRSVLLLSGNDNPITIKSRDIKNVKSQIRDELKTLLEDTQCENELSPLIHQSEVYCRICRYIDDQKMLPENDAIWQRLENAIVESYPMFKMRLNNLGWHKLNKSERHILLLVKIRISPTDIATLLGRSKSAVSYNRHSIAEKLLGEKMKLEEIDRLIRIM